MAVSHIPVMLREVLRVLEPKDGGIYVDGTFGGGGYARAVLDAADCEVVGIDRDAEAVRRASSVAKRYPGRLHLLQGRYGDMDRLVAETNHRHVDGVALDLGVSSAQLDDPERGFSFRQDGPLDMRMESHGATAADLINTLSEKELADIIYRYGEERAARRVAKAIVEARKAHPIQRTGELAEIVRRVLARAQDGIDPATRTFQALRIAVNDELRELDRGLIAAERLLGPRGRLAVVSFHSLEDRRVKSFLRERSGRAPRPSRHLPEDIATTRPSFRSLRTSAIRPSLEEVARNPRARSARLRGAERTDAPTWPTRSLSASNGGLA